MLEFVLVDYEQSALISYHKMCRVFSDKRSPRVNVDSGAPEALAKLARTVPFDVPAGST